MLEGSDAYTQPSFSFSNRARRQLWSIVSAVLFSTTPKPLHRWRIFLLRIFGAQIGQGCHIYPGVKIWAPWNLVLGNFVGIASGATLYSMDKIYIGDYSVISQGAYLCCGSHNYNSQYFELVTKPINIGSFVWVCAEAFIHMNASIKDGVVIGARSVVSKSIDSPWSIYAGNPSIKIGERQRIIRSVQSL